MKNLEKFSKGIISRYEMKSIKGGDELPPETVQTSDQMLGIFCLTGVLDGVRRNTRFNWGRCR
jgi:hypothetical protein